VFTLYPLSCNATLNISQSRQLSTTTTDLEDDEVEHEFVNKLELIILLNFEVFYHPLYHYNSLNINNIDIR
jgi:hypothetical protein